MVLTMGRWVGKVAVVTGAGAGIGAAIAKRLVREGLKVVGVDKRAELMDPFKKELENEKGQFHPRRCDVTIDEDVLEAFSWTRSNLGSVHVLINNAAVVETTNLINGDTKKWKNVLDTNILGVCIGTREAVKDMTANNVDGHIININSIGGHVSPYFAEFSNVYPASKHAVTALSETLRKELNAHKLNIKITSLSPGFVRTDILRNVDAETREMCAKLPWLDSEDVVDATIYALSTGPNVQVHELILKPLHEYL